MRVKSSPARGGPMKPLSRFLVLFLSIGAAAPAAAQRIADAWVPNALQAPVELRVTDPINGDIQFKPVHATLLPIGPLGRVMLFATVGVHARAAWFEPA